MIDLRSCNLDELTKIFEKTGEKPFRAKQAFSWIHQKGVSAIAEMTSLSKPLRDKFSKQYTIKTIKLLIKEVSEDGTVKYLWELPDGYRIESVILDDDGRKTICLSSQVGCKMDCLFCATGKQKFKRNLTVGEIISQVIEIEKDAGKISNLVYMGMGEPLDNYDNVLKSIKIFNHPDGKNIGQRKITISTCGIPPMIKELAKEKLQVTLAVSLNGSIDKVRDELMPINKKYPLTELLTALKEYQAGVQRRITVEYVLIEGKNDSRLDARGITKLFSGMNVNINLIAFNTFEGTGLRYPSNKQIKEFRWIIEDAGYEVVQRYKRGQDINAACGQLTGKYKKTQL